MCAFVDETRRNENLVYRPFNMQENAQNIIVVVTLNGEGIVANHMGRSRFPRKSSNI